MTCDGASLYTAEATTPLDRTRTPRDSTQNRITAAQYGHAS